MRTTIVVAAVACLVAHGSAQENRPTSPPAKAAPQPVDKAEPAPAPVEIKGPVTIRRDGVVLEPQVIVRAARQQGQIITFVNGRELRFEPASPKIEGAYAEALQALDEARNKLQSATEPDAAFAALDAATKALMDARAALWKLKEDEKKAKPTPEPAPQPKKDG